MDQPDGPFFRGFKTIGAPEPSNMWPQAKPLSAAEKETLEAYEEARAEAQLQEDEIQGLKQIKSILER